MKTVKILFVLIIISSLSGCSDYKKIDPDRFKIEYLGETQIDMSSTKGIKYTIKYTLDSIKINGKIILLESNKYLLFPNVKKEIVTRKFGKILIMINQKDDGMPDFLIELWMPKNQEQSIIEFLNK